MKTIKEGFGLSVLALSLLVGCGGGGGGGGTSTTELTSGEAVTGSVKEGEWDYYSIAIPAGAYAVSAVLTATSGEVDLVGKQGAKPTSAMWQADEEDCSDWSIASSYDAICSIYAPAEGTVYFGAWGNDVDSLTGSPGGDYTLVATISTSKPVAFAAQEQTDAALRKVANSYLKYLRGAAITTSSDSYPESGIVEVQKGADSFRFFFGADAVNGVLSIDHNGTWVHFQSWDEFEATLSNSVN